MKVYQEQKKWIASQDKILKQIESSEEFQSQDALNILVARTKMAMVEIKSRKPALDILEESYSQMAKDTVLEPDNFQTLLSGVRSGMQRWHSLSPRGTDALLRLQEQLQVYQDFITAYGNAVLCLTQIDVKLTRIQHLESLPMNIRNQQIKVSDSLAFFCFEIFNFLIFSIKK